ncbi:hypothetical protein [Desulfotalea psychrophila]|uniref:Uncharacterized protein n=1 Tax=Desulfotalea psychrophila (strain LSv54 / DSM 12343) TaxID=177439 RepID=Q6ALI7_DESPS|nr:hypothetical protein [Desulfotalea psychrophila]CAG36788.1 unknown protein [Desulfotalea psychrophila LSv54]
MTEGLDCSSKPHESLRRLAQIAQTLFLPTSPLLSLVEWALPQHERGLVKGGGAVSRQLSAVSYQLGLASRGFSIVKVCGSGVNVCLGVAGEIVAGCGVG